MSTTAHVAARSIARPPMSGLGRFIDELVVVAGVLLNPRHAIAEVEQMAELHRQAARLESTDPARAAQLRARASRIGLR